MEQRGHPGADPADRRPVGGVLYAVLTWLSASAIAVALSVWERSFLGPSPYGFVFLAAPPVYAAKAAWYLVNCALAGIIVRWCRPRQAWAVATFVALSAALSLLPPAPVTVVPAESAVAWMLYDPWLPYVDKMVLGLGLLLAARLAYTRAPARQGLGSR